MDRYVAEYNPGEYGERLPRWQVVEYTSDVGGARVGSVVWRTYDMIDGEYLAHEAAATLQEAYNHEFYAEFG